MRAFLMLALAIPLAADECATAVEQARRAFRQKNYPLAAREFERASAVCPPRAALLVDLARAQMTAGQIPAADQSLERALKLEPRNAAAMKLRGDVAYLLGNEREAERLFLAAAALEPNNPEPRYALGRVYYHQTRLEPAIEQFRMVLELDPKNYRAYDNLGLACEALSEPQRALQNYEKALALVHKDHPEYDSVYANVADLLYRQSEFDRSFQYAAEAASRNPNSARNFLLAGRALARLERWDLAAKWLRQSLELDPGQAAARYQLAQVYRSLGQDDAAERELKALEETRGAAPKR